MDAKSYWQLVRKPGVLALCKEARTSYRYFNHIANKKKRPSPDLARRLVAASAKLTPSSPMTFDALLIPREQMRKSIPRSAQ